MSIESEQESRADDATLTTFEARHLPDALKLSQEMGWPYRIEDWAFASSLGHGLALERDGKLIGTAMWWTFGQAHASVGMIIVSAAEQGRGFGALLVDTLLKAVEGRDVLLCATEEGLALYKRRGFIETGTVSQHQGLCRAAAAQAQNANIWPATEADLPAIQDLDQRATGMDRGPLLAALAEVSRVSVIDRAGHVAGYSMARHFGRGTVVGPVAAESIDLAKDLILEQASRLQGQFLRIDIHAQLGLSDWLESLGLERVSQVTAMVKGRQPVSDMALHLYALASQSFG